MLSALPLRGGPMWRRFLHQRGALPPLMKGSSTSKTTVCPCTTDNHHNVFARSSEDVFIASISFFISEAYRHKLRSKRLRTCALRLLIKYIKDLSSGTNRHETLHSRYYTYVRIEFCVASLHALFNGMPCSFGSITNSHGMIVTSACQ